MSRGLNIGLGVDFQPGMQEGLINSRGSTMLHEIALSCMCRADDTHAGLLGDGEDRRREAFCDRCGGTGWLYRDPKVVIGLATGIRQQRNVLDVGIAQPGDMQFSPMPSDSGCDPAFVRQISQYDKLTALWEQPLDDGQIIVRGAGTASDNRGRVTYLDDSQDRLWYEPASSMWCEDEFGNVYTENGDFILGPGKVIKWVGAQPHKGARYTIKYNAFFEHIVFSPPQERRDRDNRNLGPLAFLRRRHIALINENPAGTATDNIPLQSRVSC